MKRVTMVLTLFVLLNSAAHAAKIDIVALMLYGGSISYGGWYHNYQTWDTLPGDTWGLGVSISPNGKLINNEDTSINPRKLSNFYLYADQSRTLGIGPNPLLMLKLSDDSIVGAIFTVTGQAGIANQWERVTDNSNIPIIFINNNQQYFSSLIYSNNIELGWAKGVADKVSIEHNLFPDGYNDIYLRGGFRGKLEDNLISLSGMQISSTPIPGSAFLFAAGLISLFALRKRADR